MLDPYLNKIVSKPLEKIALEMARLKVTPDQVTVVGFTLGVIAFFEIVGGYYLIGLVFILLNRLADGIDGKLALTQGSSDAGGFLDIVFDFIFYAMVPLGFALSHPDYMSAALVLLFSFMATGSSFLAFSIMAEKNHLQNIVYPNKSFYYLGGITEGSETIIFFVLISLFPDLFNPLAYLFSFLCLSTAGFRILYGYKTLKKQKLKSR